MNTRPRILRYVFPHAAVRLAMATRFTLIAVVACTTLLPAQQKDESSSEKVGTSISLFGRGVVTDQAAIWTSPLRIRYKDITWLAPLATVTGVALATDHDVVQHLPSSPSFAKRNTQISNAGIGVLVGAGATLFLSGHLGNHQHATETGRLAAEAATDGVIFNLVVQRLTGRERPFAPTHPGEFFQGGSAFPSTHAITAWAIASVVAREYPGFLTKVLAYGTAAAVSTTRVTGKDHSPSDVIVGSAAGYLIGRCVYRKHHDANLSGTEVLSQDTTVPSKVRSPGAVGSPYVAMDSPVYDQLLRLASLGYIHSQFLGLRPWTRMVCARMLQEAEQNGVKQDNGEPSQLFEELEKEFREELRILDGGEAAPRARLDRAYTRVLGIAGTPLNDSFHFGQTVYDDFGRPYGEGLNNSTGLEGSAQAGRYVVSFRGEYQHAAAAEAYPLSVQQFLGQIDGVPQVFLPAVTNTNRLELLDTYAGIILKDWQITFGKQTLWQGPDSSTALITSNNAAPLTMFRVNRTAPLQLPSFLRHLGPVRAEFFLGITEGHHYPGHPAVQGLKLSLRPTPNLEFGFSRTVLFAGEGHGLTPRTFWRAFSSLGDNLSTIPGTSSDVGDRRGQFDFHYRLPRLRNSVAIYGDFMTDDDPSPLSAPHRSILAPGIEFTRLPGLPRLQLKAEAVMSDPASVFQYHGTFFYWNGAYHDGYTNRGNIIGSWVGRNSRAYWSEAKYWISANKTVSATFRTVQLDKDFIPGGGHQTDFSIAGAMQVQSQWRISASAQYERWNIPMLASDSHRNFTTSVELSFHPRPR